MKTRWVKTAWEKEKVANDCVQTTNIVFMEELSWKAHEDKPLVSLT